MPFTLPKWNKCFQPPGKNDGMIGLRATCAIAGVVMNKRDQRWLEVMEENCLDVKTWIRYMDNILLAIREGWRWWKGHVLL